MMEFVNAAGGRLPTKEEAIDFVKILSPYAPHLAEELWSRMGCTEPLAVASWPSYDEAALQDDTIELAIQVMGKLRGTIEVDSNATNDEVLQKARLQPNVARHLEGKRIIKEIVVPGRLINFVAK